MDRCDTEIGATGVLAPPSLKCDESRLFHKKFLFTQGAPEKQGYTRSHCQSHALGGISGETPDRLKKEVRLNPV